MLVLFIVLSAVLLSLLIWQKIKYRTLEKEITYISSRLESLSLTSENGFLLLPTDCNTVKRLGASINRLLQEFYTDKAEFKRSQKAMGQVLTNISSSSPKEENDMAHLLKLEMKKFRLLHNILFTLAAVLFSILFITVSLVDSMTDPSQTKDSFESTFLVIGLLMSFIFLVYSSVLTSRLVIREYEQKTITILFSYPLNRKQLIISKMVIIMAYTAISMTVGYICCSAYIILADKFFNMVAGSFKLYFLQTWIPTALITVAVCTILSLWPFIIGMIHKSVPAAIVTSLVAIVLRQLMITKNPTNQASLLQILLTAAVTFLFSFLIFRKKVSELY